MSFELGIIATLVFVLGLLLWGYIRSLRELASIRKEWDESEVRVRKLAGRLLKEARARAAVIIGEAKVDAEKWQSVLDLEMNKITSGQLQEYKETIHSISKNIAGDMAKEAAEFKEALEMETLGVEREVAERLKTEYQTAEAEVAEYKRLKIAEINEKTKKALEKIGGQLLGKVFSVKEHEELILKTIDEARKQNVFG